MKNWMRIVVIYAMIACCLGCSRQEDFDIEVNYEQSLMSHFYEDHGTVHIICSIEFRNVTNKDIIFRIKGRSPDDVEGGLLKTADLWGTNAKTGDEYFFIEAGEHTVFKIDFWGEYAGTLQKADRLIPEVIIII